MGLPLGISRGTFIDVANCDALDIGLAQEAQHYAQALRAYADEGDVDLVTGRNESRAPQDVTRQNGETCHRGCALRKELTPGRGTAGKVLRRGFLHTHLQKSVDGAELINTI